MDQGFIGEWKSGSPYTGSGKFRTDHGEFDGVIRKGRPLAGHGTYVDAADQSVIFKGKILDGWPVTGTGAIRIGNRLYEGTWEGGNGTGEVVCTRRSSEYKYSGEFRPWVAEGDPEQLPYKGYGAWCCDDEEFGAAGPMVFSGEWSAGEPVSGSGDWKYLDTLVYSGQLGPVAGVGVGRILSTSAHGRILEYEGEWREHLPWEGSGKISRGR
jgi:hypothetical protein